MLAFVQVLQGFRTSEPTVATVPAPSNGTPAPSSHLPSSSSRTNSEVALDIEKAKRETLEKALKEIAASRASISVPSQSSQPPAAKANPAQLDAPPARDKKPANAPQLQAALPGSSTAAQACIVVKPDFASPIVVGDGTRLCSHDDRDTAVVVSISEKTIAYSVNGDGAIRCSTGELCGMNWSSGSVLFIPRIVQNGQTYASKLFPR